MSVWLIRAGKVGEREEYAMANGVAAIGWHDLGDMTSISTRDGLRERLREVYGDAKPNTVTNWTAQVWPFLKEMKPGDIVAMPLKGRPAVVFGRIKGDLRFVPDGPHDGRNQRSVEWGPEIPRQALPQDLLYSLGALQTVCRVWKNDAESKIATLMGAKPKMVAATPQTVEADENDERVDLEGFSREKIRSAIYARFKGHGLSGLVAAVLEAQGYRTRVSPAGPDGGVDVVAGSGPLGFESPRMVVQVKSEQGAVDVKVVRELHGVMKDFGADHALVVAWGGFKSSVVRESARKFFEVRLWTSDDLVQAVLDHYDRLPPDVRAELPLKQIWTLVQESE